MNSGRSWPPWVLRHPLIWGCVFGSVLGTAAGYGLRDNGAGSLISLALSFLFVRAIGRARGGRGFMGGWSTDQLRKTCPYCLSRIRAAATVCARCGREVPASS